MVGAVSLKGFLNRSFRVGRVVGREGNVTGCDDVVVPVSVVFISDTHVPKRARDLPDSLWDRIVTCDLVVHAGDWVDVALLDEMERRSRRLVGVHGNNDHGALRERLPEIARVDVEGLRFAVVHETGDAKGREQRCAERFPDVDVLVSAPSHIPWDPTPYTGLRRLTPGSPTDRRRQPFPTYLTGTADGGRLLDVTLHQLRARPAPLPPLRSPRRQSLCWPARCAVRSSRPTPPGCAVPWGTPSTGRGRGTSRCSR